MTPMEASYLMWASDIPYCKSQRHPELVSGSISQNRTMNWADVWMLKKDQHDGV
jgi:hypothetical protein